MISRRGRSKRKHKSIWRCEGNFIWRRFEEEGRKLERRRRKGTKKKKREDERNRIDLGRKEGGERNGGGRGRMREWDD